MSNIVGTFPSGIKPLGYQQITVGSTAVGLTIPAGANRAVIGVEAQPLRYRTDGIDPTDTEGFLVKADVTFELHGNQTLKNFKAIRDDITDAVLNVNYYGE